MTKKTEDGETTEPTEKSGKLANTAIVAGAAIGSAAIAAALLYANKRKEKVEDVPKTPPSGEPAETD